MKQTLTFLLIVFFSFSVIATDTYKPYDSMTLQELEAVDTKSLDKDEKKAFKKALKAAQKTEKARLKAEKARQKEEAKARDKHNKSILKQIQLMDESYEKSYILQDDFEAYIKVLGADHHPDGNLLGLGSNLKIYFRTLFYPNSKSISFQMSVTKKYQSYEMSGESLQRTKLTPERYAYKMGYWNDYSRATLRGGELKEVASVDRTVSDCYAYCTMTEQFNVGLELADIVDIFQKNAPLEIKISGSRRDSFIITVPIPYILGYLHRLSEADPVFANMRSIFPEAKQAYYNSMMR